jgi:hypothetical protein
VLCAELLALLARRGLERALDLEERADETKGNLGAIGIGVERREEIPAAVRPGVTSVTSPVW